MFFHRRKAGTRGRPAASTTSRHTVSRSSSLSSSQQRTDVALAERDRKSPMGDFFGEGGSLNQSRAAWRDRQLEQGEADAVAALITLILGLVLTSRGFWKCLLVFLAIGFVWRLMQ